MVRDGDSGVRVLGDPIPFADGAEDELLAVVSAASDRSSVSDELAAHVRDWPTRYHLARERSHLLRPLALGPGMRVLDVGAGTGALARHLGETGAAVVALEGNLSRARVAAARCADLPAVEAVCGTPAVLDDPDGFDVVVVSGVLEYTADVRGGSGGAEAFLAAVRRLTRPGGALALAIENQFGLKYLAGLPEDHTGRPWLGLEGYPGRAIRTWSRRDLRALLAAAGFPDQRWLYPFPDYKLPTVVLDHGAYALGDAEVVIDQIVREPVREFAHQAQPAFDTRRAHRQLIGAGLGPDVANSFLVVAWDGPPPAVLPRTDAVAWRYDGERLARWRRETVVSGGGDGLLVESAPVVAGGGGVVDWLSQATPASRVWTRGATVEQRFLDACADGSDADVAAALQPWARHVRSLELPPGGEAPHPFRPEGARAVLPPECLDLELGNFVHEGDGLAHIDTEWRAAGGVDSDLAAVRALWYAASRVVAAGTPTPWPSSTTVDDLTRHLGSLAGVEVTPGRLDEFRSAEAALQVLVRGVDRHACRQDLERVGAASQATSPTAALSRRETAPGTAEVPTPPPHPGRRRPGVRGWLGRGVPPGAG
jgi:SAM-dependent methyltransferase